MTAWLVEHPPVRSQFRCPRREEPSGVVAVHTAENAPDWAAFDGGAEAVARFIQGRSDPGSYHDLVDSDSAINLVAYDCEAFHDGTGTNAHSYGLSFATRAAVWPLTPAAWRDGAIHQGAAAAARYARWLRARRGIIIPARWITAGQARARVPGFVTHAALDPGRRTDPGAGFPHDQFLVTYAQLSGQAPTEDNDMLTDADIPIIRKALRAEIAEQGSPTRTALVELIRGQIASEAGGLNQALDRWAAGAGLRRPVNVEAATAEIAGQLGVPDDDRLRRVITDVLG